MCKLLDSARTLRGLKIGVVYFKSLALAAVLVPCVFPRATWAQTSLAQSSSHSFESGVASTLASFESGPQGGPDGAACDFSRGYWGGCYSEVCRWGTCCRSSCQQGDPNCVDCFDVRRNGRLVTWGSNRFGQGDFPSGVQWNWVMSLAAGHHHGLAITHDGKLHAWGRNDGGQGEIPEEYANRFFKAVAAGQESSIVLDSSGKVHAWGRVIEVPSYFSDFQIEAIAAGAYHQLALTSEGRVLAWGTGPEVFVPGFFVGRVFKAIAAGASHSLALTEDGEVFAWGGNDKGQSTVPSRVSRQRIKAISTKGDHNLALTEEGKVLAWGNEEEFPQLTELPEEVRNATVVKISAGWDDSLAITDEGKILRWGRFGVSIPARILVPGVEALHVAAGRDFRMVYVEQENDYNFSGDLCAEQEVCKSGRCKERACCDETCSPGDTECQLCDEDQGLPAPLAPLWMILSPVPFVLAARRRSV